METTKKCKMALKAEELMRRLEEVIYWVDCEKSGLETFVNSTEEDEKSEWNWEQLEYFEDTISALENVFDDEE